MIQKDIGIGRIIITDTAFGHVSAGDETFLERFRNHFGEVPATISWMNQVHGDVVQSTGFVDGSEVVFLDCDGLLSNQEGMMLITKTADCVPILLWNTEEKIIAALHCGWKGYLAGIIEGFVALCESYDISPSSFSAYIGPHLRARHFEVQQDFIDQLIQKDQDLLVEQGGKTFFNLTEGVHRTLLSFDITAIEDSEGLHLTKSAPSTFDSPEYFSYRKWRNTPETERDPNYSTFANCIWLQ